jgi:uncharacterized BrkB/YihY/UPF0761 family membrane protein
MLWTVAKEATSNWSSHRDSRQGAALAYYSVFSLGPIIVIAIAWWEQSSCSSFTAWSRADAGAQFEPTPFPVLSNSSRAIFHAAGTKLLNRNGGEDLPCLSTPMYLARSESSVDSGGSCVL